MKASGSGRIPSNFCKAASTSSVAASPSGSCPAASAFACLAPVAAGQIGNELEQHVGRGRQRYAIGQRFAQRAPADRKIRRRVERSDHRIDQAGSLAGKMPSESPTT